MTRHFYDPKQYPALKRKWDDEKKQILDIWETMEDFTMFLCDGRKIFIAKGFKYDKASSPTAFWWYLPRDDKHVIIAALVHDYLYTVQVIEGIWIPRKQADQIFYELILQAGMRFTKSFLVHKMVRAWGWRFFNKRASSLRNPYYIKA